MVYAVFTVAFLGLSGWCVFRAFHNRACRLRLLANPVEVRGEIVQLDDISSSEDTIRLYVPRVRYDDTEGGTHEAALLPTGEPKRYRVGKSVLITYERGNPANLIHRERTWDVNAYCGLSLGMALLAILFAIDCCQKLAMQR